MRAVISDVVEQLEVRAATVKGRTYDCAELARLAVAALERELAEPGTSWLGRKGGALLPVELLVGLNEDGTVSLGMVSIEQDEPPEGWASESPYDELQRVSRLALEVLTPVGPEQSGGAS